MSVGTGGGVVSALRVIVTTAPVLEVLALSITFPE